MINTAIMLTEDHILDDNTFPSNLWASSSLRLTMNIDTYRIHFNTNFNTNSPSIVVRYYSELSSNRKLN